MGTLSFVSVIPIVKLSTPLSILKNRQPCFPFPTITHFAANSATRMLSRWIASDRPNIDDVDRLSRGQAAKRRGTGSRAVPHRLNAEEREGYDRAIQHGFLTLPSNLGSRRERKGSPLFNIWRMWNDAQQRPAVFFVKRGGRLSSDEVWVDISTLLRPANRLPLNAPAIADVVGKIESAAACTNGIVQSNDTVINVSSVLSGDDESEGEGEKIGEYSIDFVEDHDGENISFLPTWRLPELWIKYRFDGRSEAKAAARNLTELFGTMVVKSKHQKGKGKKGSHGAVDEHEG